MIAGAPSASSTASERISGAEDGKHLLGGLGVFEFGAAFLVAQKSREARERLQVALELPLRREQQHAEPDRLVIERLKIDWWIQSCDNRDYVRDRGNTGMRHGDPVANAGA